MTLNENKNKNIYLCVSHLYLRQLVVLPYSAESGGVGWLEVYKHPFVAIMIEVSDCLHAHGLGLLPVFRSDVQSTVTKYYLTHLPIYAITSVF